MPIQETGTGKIADMLSIPVSSSKVREDHRRTIDRLARQTEGIAKALKRIKEAL